jgi:hypothetical protein
MRSPMWRVLSPYSGIYDADGHEFTDLLADCMLVFRAAGIMLTR